MGFGKAVQKVRRAFAKTGKKLSNVTKLSCLRPSASDVIIGKTVEKVEKTSQGTDPDPARGGATSEVNGRPLERGNRLLPSDVVVTQTPLDATAVDHGTDLSENTSDTSILDEADLSPGPTGSSVRKPRKAGKGEAISVASSCPSSPANGSPVNLTSEEVIASVPSESPRCVRTQERPPLSDVILSGTATRTIADSDSVSQLTDGAIAPNFDEATNDPPAPEKAAGGPPNERTLHGADFEMVTTNEACADTPVFDRAQDGAEKNHMISSGLFETASVNFAKLTKLTATKKKKLLQQRSKRNPQILHEHDQCPEWDQRDEKQVSDRNLQDNQRRTADDEHCSGGGVKATTVILSSPSTDGKTVVDRLPGEIRQTASSCSQHAHPFHHACALKAKPSILFELLLLHPSMARKRDGKGNLPIHRLADNCGSAFIPVLCELIRQFPHGVEDEDDRGRLPLHRVCKSRKKMSIEVVKVLVEASPSCLTRRVDGLLPIHLLCLNTRTAPRVVELVASRAPMTVAAATTGDSPGRFPLHIACKVRSKHMPDIVAVLMRIAPEVAGIACPNGEYPLHLATASGNTAAIRAILDAYPDAARICDHTGSLPVHTAYLRWHFSSLTIGEEAETLDPLMALLQAYPEGLYHCRANGERIIDSACKKPNDKLELLLSAAYPLHTTSSLQVEGFLPENLEAAQFHMIPPKIVHVLRQLHPLSVNVTHDGDGYVIA